MDERGRRLQQPRISSFQEAKSVSLRRFQLPAAQALNGDESLRHEMEGKEKTKNKSLPVTGPQDCRAVPVSVGSFGFNGRGARQDEPGPPREMEAAEDTRAPLPLWKDQM